MGNILAVVTDRKAPSVNGSNYDYFNAQITSITNYYPFGMQIEERSWTANSYRFGFNGMEQDDEVNGNGNSYTTEYRQLDVRLCRWLSLDPLMSKFPWQSPYISMDNSPLVLIDFSGASTLPTTESKIRMDQAARNRQNSNSDASGGDLYPTGKCTQCPSGWEDLVNFEVQKWLVNGARLRLGDPAIHTQYLVNASGENINLDFYMVNIKKFPSIDGKQLTPQELFHYVRINFGDFLEGGNTTMSFHNGSEMIRWGGTPMGTVVNFKAKTGILTDMFSVITSDFITGESWTFSTISSGMGIKEAHPLSGNRQFGISPSFGYYVFYTRAADRLSTLMHHPGASTIFEGADRLWRALMKNVADFVNENGGEAEIDPGNGAKRYIYEQNTDE